MDLVRAVAEPVPFVGYGVGDDESLVLVLDVPCMRARSWSGQRLFASVVLPRPSVIESPTIARAEDGWDWRVSMDEIKYLRGQRDEL